MHSKNGKKYFIYKIIILLLLILIFIIINSKNKNLKKFIILYRKKSNAGGLLCYYYRNIGCVHDYLFNGYIPIIDLISHPNIFNGFNTTITKNPWEIFFNQPFNYSLDNVKKKKNIEYAECRYGKKGPNFSIFFNKIMREYWHNFAKKYVPIKSEIIQEANSKFALLFNNSINVLGILIRGTDYIAKKPHGHQIQPNPKTVFKDIKKMDKKNKYNLLFLTTEDDLIREEFIQEFGKKIKYIKSKTKINYDYKRKEYLGYNENIKGNIEFQKIYLINIIILSKCLDIIASKTGGSLVAFILTKEFRNMIVYSLGHYK